jgi:hypothetical protein
MITVSGQLTDQLRDKKDFISSLLTKAESFVTFYPKVCYFSLTRSIGPVPAAGSEPYRQAVPA